MERADIKRRVSPRGEKKEDLGGEALQRIETELEGAGGRWHRLGHRLLYHRGVRWLRYESISGVKRDSVMGVQRREASKVTAIIFFFFFPFNTEISFPFPSFLLALLRRRRIE